MSFASSTSPITVTAGPVLPTMSLSGSFAAAAAAAKKRCCVTDCKKKLGMLGFDCRCGMQFCGTHRYPDTHKCTYDHRAASKAVLTAALQSCVADKMGGDRV